MALPKKPKKKLILPVFLIFFLGAVFFAGWFKKTDINFDFNFFQNKGMVNPLPLPSQKEELYSLLKSYDLVPEKLDFREKEAEASFSGSLTAKFSLEKELSSQVVSLHFILSRTKIEGKIPKLVDLRFEKPLVSY